MSRNILMFALILIFLAGCSSSYQSVEEIFLSDISEKIKDSEKISAVKQAFISRQWSVIDEGTSEVTGVIKHRGIDAKVTVLISGNDLIYRCSGTREVVQRSPSVGGVREATKSVVEFCPKKWVNNLRHDAQITMMKF